MRKMPGILFFFFALSACAQKPPALSRPASAVGDIFFGKAIDDSSFLICDSSRVFQYYNTDSYFLNHKDSFRIYFLTHFIPAPDTPGQSGYITIKFIINCEGATGRFRMTEMDSTYQPRNFDKRISGQLLSLVKSLRDWNPARYKGKNYDSYQYITFRIRNGRITTISP
jgi:hypothetical protein